MVKLELSSIDNLSRVRTALREARPTFATTLPPAPAPQPAPSQERGGLFREITQALVEADHHRSRQEHQRSTRPLHPQHQAHTFPPASAALQYPAFSTHPGSSAPTAFHSTERARHL